MQEERRQKERAEIDRREKRREKQRWGKRYSHLMPVLVLLPRVEELLLTLARCLGSLPGLTRAAAFQHPSFDLWSYDGCRLEERRNEKLSKHWSRRRSQTRSPDPRRDRREQSERDRLPHTERERGRTSGITQKEREDAHKRRREKEAAELDDEIDKRRKRIEAWQVSLLAVSGGGHLPPMCRPACIPEPLDNLSVLRCKCGWHMGFLQRLTQ